MLEFVRRTASTWIIWILLVLVGVPFAFFGISDYVAAPSAASVAKVNGTEIGVRAFQAAYQRQRRQLQNLIGRDLEAAGITDERIRQQALERLINEELLLQAAAADGLRIGDRQLALAVHELPPFRGEAGFSEERYQSWLRSQGYTPGGFEYEMRRSMLSEQLVTGVALSSFTTQPEADRVRRLRGQERVYSQLVVDAGRFADLEVDAAAIQSYFEANRERFVTPERVRIEYLELSRDRLAEAVQVGEEELRSHYEANKDNYVTAEQREARHILITLDADADDAAVAAARDRLAELKGLVESRAATFGDLAREHSQDPGSAPNGGALGWFGRDVMDPAFEEAAFSQAKGTVGAPVRSAFGMHLIEVTDVKPRETREFADARSDILRELQNAQVEQIYYEQAERLANLSFEHPESLTVAAESLGLEPRQSTLFGRDGSGATGVAAEPRVVQAAFSPEVLGAGNNSDPIELGDGRLVVVRVKEHLKSEPRTLDDVRDQIAAQLRAVKMREETLALGGKLLDRLRAGEALDTLAADAGSSWSEERTASREAPAVEPDVLRALFAAPAPREGQASYAGVTLRNGSYAIVAVRSIRDGGGAAQSADVDGISRAIASDRGRAEVEALLGALRGEGEVVVRAENL